MREEFHGLLSADGTVVAAHKQLYGWGTINANVWLPSLSELVGIDSNQYNGTRGCYLSSLQGLNTSVAYWTDANGGMQWNYFKQYNASGGGEAIMNICNQQMSWLRSSVCTTAKSAWRTTNAQQVHTPAVTASCAVHPAVGDRFKVSFRLYPLIRNKKIPGEAGDEGRARGVPCGANQRCMGI